LLTLHKTQVTSQPTRTHAIYTSLNGEEVGLG